MLIYYIIFRFHPDGAVSARGLYSTVPGPGSTSKYVKSNSLIFPKQSYGCVCLLCDAAPIQVVDPLLTFVFCDLCVLQCLCSFWLLFCIAQAYREKCIAQTAKVCGVQCMVGLLPSIATTKCKDSLLPNTCFGVMRCGVALAVSRGAFSCLGFTASAR